MNPRLHLFLLWCLLPRIDVARTAEDADVEAEDGLATEKQDGAKKSSTFNIPGDTELEVDLLQAIKQPIQDPSVYQAKGMEGLPGFGFRPGHTVRVPYRLFLPKRFFRDFSILATIRPDEDAGGYLFAIVNPFDTIVELGVLLDAAGPYHTNISLVYTDHKKDPTDSKAIASFLVPKLTGNWTQLALKVDHNDITLYLRCKKYQKLEVKRKPKQLVFDDASKLYVGQAGPIIRREFVINEGSGDDGVTQSDTDIESEFMTSSSSRKAKPTERTSTVTTTLPPPPFPSTPPPEPPPVQVLPAKLLGYGDSSRRLSSAAAASLSSFPSHRLRPPNSDNLILPWSQVLRPAPAAEKENYLNAKHHQSALTGYFSSGYPGPKGEQGEQGEMGPPGVCSVDTCQTVVGRPGLPGVDGIRGEKGDRGPPGDIAEISASFKGEKGDPGPTGPVGPPGPPGPQGEIGLNGHQGHRGRQGSKGEKGDSTFGLPGPEGPRGVPGLPGPPGPPGAPGIPGTYATQDIPNVVPGSYKSPHSGSASHTIYETGTTMTPSAVVYETNLALFYASRKIPVGTLAFSISSQELFLRVSDGWRELKMGDFHKAPEDITSLATSAPFSSAVSALDRPFLDNKGVVLRGHSKKTAADKLKSRVHQRPSYHILSRHSHQPWLSDDTSANNARRAPTNRFGLTADNVLQADTQAFHLHPPLTSGLGVTLLEKIIEAHANTSAGEHAETADAIRVSNKDPNEITINQELTADDDAIDEPLNEMELQDDDRNSSNIFSEKQTDKPKVPFRSAAANAELTEDDMLHLAALNSPYTGNMHGVRGADFACYHQARAAGFTTTFRAFLSSQVQDIDKIMHFRDKDSPVTNLKGEVLFNAWSDIFQDNGGHLPKNVTILSFDRRDVLNDPSWPQKLLWHGSDVKGIRKEHQFCEAWRSSSSKHSAHASALNKRLLLGQQEMSCDNAFVVLCIENMSKNKLAAKRWQVRRRNANVERELEQVVRLNSMTAKVSNEQNRRTKP